MFKKREIKKIKSRFKNVLNTDDATKNNEEQLENKLFLYVLGFKYKETTYSIIIIIIIITMLTSLVFFLLGVITTNLNICPKWQMLSITLSILSFFIGMVFCYFVYRNSEKEQVFNRTTGDFRLFIYYKLVLKTANFKSKKIMEFRKKNVYDVIYDRFYRLLKAEKANLENHIEPNKHYLNHLENVLEKLEYKNSRGQINENNITNMEKIFNKLFNSKYNLYEKVHNCNPKYNFSELYMKILNKTTTDVDGAFGDNYSGTAFMITASIVFFISSIYISNSDEYNFIEVYSFIGTTVTLIAILLYFWDKRIK